ncbi:putative extracellular protein [Pseudomonas sp. R2-37-08W]|uniref:GlcG/HbpS family heme-binding protein n=1 Tax=Pseudomonas sp. R2-37-08W TaxID=1173273 RepID=UPI000F5618F4|nr:heme-binding protein [Pseudomonas sp. R2-37-08W]AZF08437.1 putative extracellular protein [Pseudomonas sp. R2-37-08W]
MYRTALFLSLAVATAAQATPQLPRHATLDLRTARQLADASLAHCNAALTVLDRGGNLLLSLRADDVGPHNSLASQRKAYTALSTKTPTRLFAERARNNPEAANLNSLPELLLLGGGVPLFAESELVGALGIAGAGGAPQDEACAVQAAEQLGLKISP